MIFESVLPSFDFNFGGILFTKNSNGDPKESTCAPGLKGFEVQIEDQQHQLRILTSPDLQDQDQFIETIGDIICQNLSGRVYPDFIDYGVEHGLTYYLAELDGYTPLLESNYSKQDTVDYLTQFISKLEKVSYFDPEKDRIYLESLWVNASGDIVISDVVLQDGIDSNKRENINSIIDCYLQISDCEKIETISISKPQTISALKDWLTDQTSKVLRRLIPSQNRN